MKTMPHERVVSEVFATREEAHRALDALAPTGIETENISVIANLADYEAEEFSEIVGIRMHDESVHAGKVGRMVGAIVAGLTALFGMIFGHVAALQSVLVIIGCSAFGALLGTLIGAGFTENEWEKLDRAMRSGKVLLVVHTTHFSLARQVSQILKNCHAQGVHAH